MRCLILGGAGFLGSHLCEALTAQGHAVVVFDRAVAEGAAWRNAEWVVGDFSTEYDFKSLLKEIDVVFHLISTTVPANDDAALDVMNNVLPTLALLEACKDKAIRCVFFSSGGTVYGMPEEVPIKETHATNPICSYGVQKLTIEKYLQLQRHSSGLDYLILRVANPYGERQTPFRPQGVISTFLAKTLLGEEIEVWGDGSVVRDYLYVKDVAKAALACLDYCGPQRIFNIGSGCGHDLKEILATITKVTARSPQVKFMPSRRQDLPVNVLAIELAESELGWKPEIALEEGLQRMLNAWQPEERRFSKEEA